MLNRYLFQDLRVVQRHEQRGGVCAARARQHGLPAGVQVKERRHIVHTVAHDHPAIVRGGVLRHRLCRQHHHGRAAG